VVTKKKRLNKANYFYLFGWPIGVKEDNLPSLRLARVFMSVPIVWCQVAFYARAAMESMRNVAKEDVVTDLWELEGTK